MQTICKFNGYKSSLTYVVHNMKQVLDALLFIITLVFMVLCLCWIVCVLVLPGLWFAHSAFPRGGGGTPTWNRRDARRKF